MKKQIRNSTAEFLIFTSQAGENTIEVKVEDETVWLTQKLIAELFDKSVPTINEHLKNIFASEELEENSVVRNFRITAKDGKNYATQIAKDHALSEFEKYRVVQDRLFLSDFDKLLGKIGEK